MKRALFITVALGILVSDAGETRATDFYVNGANPGAQSGTQQSPFRTVQAAIDAADDGDKIRVAGGSYAENLRIRGKAVVLEGGYSTNWTRDIESNTTTLSGAGGNAVINLLAADATIDGFRITGGTGSTEELPYGYHGGGIYSRDGSPTIKNNIIEGNDVRSGDPPYNYFFGGGLHVSNAPSATILNNVVRGNFAGRGAGMSVLAQSALIQGNIVEDNVAVGDHGGGLFIGVVDARITQNIIRGNEVGRELGYGWGGGLIFFNAGNSAEISFNEVYENFAAGYGAGEFIDEGAHADIHHELIYRNLSQDGCEAVSAVALDGGDGVGSTATISFCTIAGNVCETVIRGNGLQVEGMSTATVTNSIFWNNGGDDFAVDGTSTLTVTYTDSQEPIAGTGNISANPRFVNEAGDDYHLAAGSPCVDAGDPASPFGNEPAPNGGRADMGRYGNATDEPTPGGSNANENENANDNTSNDNSAGGGTGNENSNSGNVNANDNASANTNENAGGANSSNENAGGGGNSNADNGGDEGNDGTDGVSGAGLCPTTAAMLLSISLIGVRRGRRGRSGR